MDRFKFETFKAEFPFAFNDNLDAKKIDRIQIKRLDDLNVNYLRAEYVSVGNSLFSRDEDTKVSIFDEKGSRLGNLIQSKTIGSIGVAYQPDAECDNKGETLLEWCSQHPEIVKRRRNPFYGPDREKHWVDQIAFVVEDSSGYDSTRDDQEWRTITIYKPPKQISIMEIVFAAQEKAVAEVKKEASF